MIVLYAALFFVAAAVAVGWVVFPGIPRRLLQRLARVAQAVAARAVGVGKGASGIAARSEHAVRDAGGLFGDLFRRHRAVLVVALLLLVVPPLLILATRRTVVLEGFTQEDLSESSSLVAQLLRGERLKPPPPPPPELFTTAEIFRMKPEIVNADRRWEQVNPDLQQRVLAIHEVMRRQYGYEMVLVEGYRSPERQAELMREGKATRAGAWQSCHQYGLAVDSAPIRDGKLQWNMEDTWTRQAYFLYGELAVQAGLEWGGNWRSLKDYVHVEMTAECRRARAARLAAQPAG